MSELVGPLRGGVQRIPRPAGVRLGRGAAWFRSGAPFGLSTDDVRRRLSGPPVLSGPPTGPEILGGRRLAAVLVALFDEDDDVHVVLTRRAAGLRSHTGEVSFPGGRLEPGETAMAAALRESREEVDLDAVDVVAQLSPLSTWSSDSTIIPFVGLLAERPVLHPNPFEVERAFTVSLSELASPACYHEELWPSVDGTVRSMAFFDVVGDTVWGATGRILDDLLSRLAGTTPGDPDSLGTS